MLLWNIWNVSFVPVLPNVVVVIRCWQERYFSVFHELHVSLVAFRLTFRSSWLFLIVSAPISGLKDVFLQSAITEIVLYTSANVQLMFNKSQSLLTIFLIFGKVGLYVTKNGMFFLTVLVLLNRADLFRLSNFLF